MLRGRTNFLIGLIIFIGLFFRLHNLGSKSLWFDEAQLLLASVDIKGAVKLLVNCYEPNLFYRVFIFYWRHVSPYINEWLLRVPSVIFALAAIYLIYKLGGLLFNSTEIALVSAFLLSVSPMHIYYSQEATAYSFMIFITLAVVYCFLRLPERKEAWLGSYVLLNLIGIYTHPVMFLVLFIENMVLFFKRKTYTGLFRKILFCNLIVILLYTPVLFSLFSARRLLFDKNSFFYEKALGWISIPTLESLGYTFRNFTTGYNSPWSFYPAATIFFLVLFILGVRKLINKEYSIVVWLFFSLPIFLFIFSKVGLFSLYLDRYLLSCLPFLYMTIAFGLRTFKNIYTRTAIIFIILCLSLVSLYNYYFDILPGRYEMHKGVPPKYDIRAAAAYISESYRPGDVVYHTCRSTALPFEYYLDFHFRKIPNIFGFYTERKANKQNILLYVFDRDIIERYRYMLFDIPFQSEYIKLNDEEKSAEDRIWLVYSSWVFNRSNEKELRAVQYMDEHYLQIAKKEFKGITVYLYVKNEAPRAKACGFLKQNT